MYVLDCPQPSLLILGGNSSLAVHLIHEALEENYQVTATSKQPLPVPNAREVKWVNLDLSSPSSIDSFFLTIKNSLFERIIYCIGKTSGSMSEIKSITETDAYFRTQLSHGAYVLEKLLLHLETEFASQMIFVSSRAATFPSFDANYAACKAGLQAHVRSLSIKVTPNQSLVSVIPGLILNSKMYFDMPNDVRESHVARSENRLLTVEQAAKEIWKIEKTDSIKMNGAVIEIGPTYK